MYIGFSVLNKEEFVEQSHKLLSLCHHLQVVDETWALVPALLNDLNFFCKLNDIKIELVEQKNVFINILILFCGYWLSKF